MPHRHKAEICDIGDGLGDRPTLPEQTDPPTPQCLNSRVRVVGINNQLPYESLGRKPNLSVAITPLKVSGGQLVVSNFRIVGYQRVRFEFGLFFNAKKKGRLFTGLQLRGENVQRKSRGLRRIRAPTAACMRSRNHRSGRQSNRRRWHR